MKPASASRLLAVAAAACAVAMLGSCKTVRTENWYKGDAGLTEWEKGINEDFQENLDTMNALARGDKNVDYIGSEFDQKTIGSKTSNYDKKIAREKTFRTKDFAGAGEYKHNDYQFLKRQDYQAKTVRDQNQLYAEGSSEAPEEKRRFFWQRKKARTKAFNESDKLARTGNYRDAEASLKRLENRDLTIVDDRAKADGASLTLGDVRTLLHGSDE